MAHDMARAASTKGEGDDDSKPPPSPRIEGEDAPKATLNLIPRMIDRPSLRMFARSPKTLTPREELLLLKAKQEQMAKEAAAAKAPPKEKKARPPSYLHKASLWSILTFGYV